MLRPKLFKCFGRSFSNASAEAFADLAKKYKWKARVDKVNSRLTIALPSMSQLAMNTRSRSSEVPDIAGAQRRQAETSTPSAPPADPERKITDPTASSEAQKEYAQKLVASLDTPLLRKQLEMPPVDHSPQQKSFSNCSSVNSSECFEEDDDFEAAVAKLMAADRDVVPRPRFYEISGGDGRFEPKYRHEVEFVTDNYKTVFAAQNTGSFGNEGALCSFAIQHKGHFGSHVVCMEQKNAQGETTHAQIMSMSHFLHAFEDVQYIAGRILDNANLVCSYWNSEFAHKPEKLNMRDSSTQWFARTTEDQHSQRDSNKIIMVMFAVTSWNFNLKAHNNADIKEMRKEDCYVQLKFRSKLYNKNEVKAGGLSMPVMEFIEILTDPKMKLFYEKVQNLVRCNPAAQRSVFMN